MRKIVVMSAVLAACAAGAVLAGPASAADLVPKGPFVFTPALYKGNTGACIRELVPYEGEPSGRLAGDGGCNSEGDKWTAQKLDDGSLAFRNVELGDCLQWKEEKKTESSENGDTHTGPGSPISRYVAGDCKTAAHLTVEAAPKGAPKGAVVIKDGDFLLSGTQGTPVLDRVPLSYADALGYQWFIKPAP
ncbi:hypothetical protein [Nocardia sp. NPDC057030]|uniref:hypothetical protein n=1 Tax=unclassified Nocardia TaxID=2637762 RepID=UPI00362E4F0E